MDLQAAKLELVKLILNIENQSVIDELLNSLKTKENDWWEDLTENEKELIQLGIDQLDAGNRISLDDFIRKEAKNA
jgi:hypothetical protein